MQILAPAPAQTNQEFWGWSSPCFIKPPRWAWYIRSLRIIILRENGERIHYEPRPLLDTFLCLFIFSWSFLSSCFGIGWDDAEPGSRIYWLLHCPRMNATMLFEVNFRSLWHIVKTCYQRKDKRSSWDCCPSELNALAFVWSWAIKIGPYLFEKHCPEFATQLLLFHMVCHLQRIPFV